MDYSHIEKNVQEIIKTLPDGVTLVAAAKTRSTEEVQAAINGGIKVVGYNYLQEAEKIYRVIGDRVQWHMIGHLQRNKVKKALQLFDMIETVDSVRLAEEIDKQCTLTGKSIPVLIEINSGREENKTGIFPEDIEKFVADISCYKNIRIQGLMTMGLYMGEPEQIREYFRITRNAFESLKKLNVPGVEMKYLSMGMSDSYNIALEEGANIIRIGTKLFGERSY